MEYVQDYIQEFGAKKCEANAIVTIPDAARNFVDEIIRGYIGDDAKERFKDKYRKVVTEVEEFRDKTGMTETLQNALDLIKEE